MKLFGRRTDELFAGSWGAVEEMRARPVGVALNDRPKYVASTTLAGPRWANTTVLSGDLAAARARGCSPGLNNAYAGLFHRRPTSWTGETTGKQVLISPRRSVIMAAIGLTVGGLLVLAMIAVSVRGWLTLPSDARVPIHHGLRGYGNYLSKPAGLLLWPASGIVIYGLYTGVFAEALATHYRRLGVPLLVLPAVLAVLITVQIGALRAAGKSSGLG